MSPHKTLFGAGKDRGAPLSLGEALARLLGPSGEAEPRRGRRQRRDRERPALPAAAAREWQDAARGARGELVAARLAGSTPDLVLLGFDDEAGDRVELSRIAAFLAGLGAPEGVARGIVLAERAGERSLLAARGWTGGGRKFLARDGRLLLHLAESLAAAIESRLESEPEALDAYDPDAAPNLPSPDRLGLDGGLDFALSHFLVPPFFPLGPAPAPGAQPPEAAVFWDEIAIEPDPPASSLWFAAQLGDPKLGLVLVLECPADRPDRAEYGARLAPILRAAWARTAQRLAKFAPAGSAARFGALQAPPATLLKGAVRAAGEIRIGAGGFPFAAHAGPRLLATLAAALKDRPERAAGDGELAAALALNEALSRLWGPAIRDPFLRPRTPAGCERKAAAPPLAGLLACLGPRDAAIAAQNCLVPEYGVKELPYLFYYHAPYERNGKRAMRPVPLAPMRDADVLRLLPAAAREDWEQERRFDLPQRTQTASNCVAANDAAARLLWDAARSGKIELSPASQDLLERVVGKPLEAASRARLEALVAKDLPFGLLATLDRRDAARIVDRVPNRELALASLGDERHLELLRSCMGSGRRLDFKEERELVGKRLERGELEVERAVEAKLALFAKMKEIAEELKRERAASPEKAAPQLRASRPRA